MGDGDHWTFYGKGLEKIEATKGYKQIYGCIFIEITCSNREAWHYLETNIE